MDTPRHQIAELTVTLMIKRLDGTTKYIRSPKHIGLEEHTSRKVERLILTSAIDTIMEMDRLELLQPATN